MEESHAHELTALLLEDDPTDAELFGHLLSEYVAPRYAVVTAGTLKAAETLLQARSVDVCLLDYNMEPISGLQMLPLLRAAGMRGPVIFLTGVEHEAADLACLAAGADGFLPKRLADGPMLERTLRYARAQYQGRQQMALVGTIDPITQMLHRGSFLDQLAGALLRPERGVALGQLCVAYFGIRRFKQINVRHGREFGDQVLRQFGQRLQQELGAGAVLGRMVGDEFAIFAADARRTTFSAQVRQGVEACAKPFAIAGQIVQIDIVAGITTYPYDAVTAALLLERAELAMHAAKESANPRALCVFDISQLTALKYHGILERELRLAIQRNKLSIVMEPVFRTADLRIVGAEVLSRWEHQTDAWISPGEFIPLAERSDLILAITDSVLEKTAACLQEWLQAGLIDNHFRAYVNVPASFLMLPNAEQRLLGPLRRRDLPAQMLGLELTERSLFDIDDTHRQLLERLRDAGVSLVIDDFGTGFSSLSYLCDLPVDQIKIDRSFLVASQTNPRGVLIIRSIVALGASLGLRVLAEGVETEAMLDMVTAEGAELMQGYLHGRPQRPDAFALKLQNQIALS